jgi:hypothetical protein
MPGAPEGLIPFVVGTAGHRDVLSEDVPALEKAVASIFEALQARMPSTPLLLLSALAAGADQLTARVGLRCGVRLAAVLPMPRSVYRAQIEADSRAGFDDLLSKASVVIDLPSGDIAEAELAASEELLNARYELLAIYLAANSQGLIALWDGVPVPKPGSTSRVVQYHLEGPPEPDAGAALPAGGGTVYHVRARRQSNPEAGGDPSKITILPGRANSERNSHPESRDLERSLERYNRDVHAAGLEHFRPASLLPEHMARTLPGFTRHVEMVYNAADGLSLKFNRRSRTVLKVLLLCALVAVAGFEAYAHLFPEAPAIWLVYPAALLAGWITYRHAARAGIERRYLDYRALAEALRVQFFWDLCGIHKPVADWYLRRHESGADWIRHALRGVYLACQGPEEHDAIIGMEQTLGCWVESQAAWYRRRARHQTRLLGLVEHWSTRLLFTLWLLSIAIPLSLLLRWNWLASWQSVAIRQPWHGLLLLLIPVPSLAAGLCRIWVDQAGFSEQVRRYRHMAGIFGVAARRLAASLKARDIEEGRETVYRLGIDSLDENADWLLLHRARPLKVVGGG